MHHCIVFLIQSDIQPDDFQSGDAVGLTVVQRLSKQLNESEAKLQETQEREIKLQNDLADMTSRAEDSEIISKQRMELVKSTLEKLKKSEEAVAQQRKKQDELNEEVAEWATKTSAAVKQSTKKSTYPIRSLTGKILKSSKNPACFRTWLSYATGCCVVF